MAELTEGSRCIILKRYQSRLDGAKRWSLNIDRTELQKLGVVSLQLASRS